MFLLPILLALARLCSGFFQNPSTHHHDAALISIVRPPSPSSSPPLLSSRIPRLASRRYYLSFKFKGLLGSNEEEEVEIVCREEMMEQATTTSKPITENIPSSLLPRLIVLLGIILFFSAPTTSFAAVDPTIVGDSIHAPSSAFEAFKSLDYRYFVAGGTCAAISHGVTTPVDVVKTKIQADPEKYKNYSLWRATRLIVERDGPEVLLGGLGPTFVGYGVEGAMKFGLYESLKPVFSDLFSSTITSNSSPAVAYLCASVVAGAVASLLLCPMERTRIRLVTDPNFASGLLTGLPRLVQERGLPYVFSGMPAMLSKQVPYTFTKQVSFDMFTGILYTVAANANVAVAAVKAEVPILAAFFASILSCIASHPGDVILTATYKGNTGDGQGSQRSGNSNNDSTFIQTISDLYKKEGLGAFFTGISARFIHIGLIITSQLVLYDIIKQLLGLPATGTS